MISQLTENRQLTFAMKHSDYTVKAISAVQRGGFITFY